MKDIVENRQRISFGKKLKIAWLAFRENGFLWSFYMGVYYITSAISNKAFNAMDRRRRKKGLPGLNSARMNKLIWEAWDWEAGGEEWSPSPEWKQSVIDCVLKKYIPEGKHIIEIGPGGGRWTEEILKTASKLTAFDISESCIETCKKKFADHNNAEFLLTSGADLDGASDNSIDAVWSFDVFVHINRKEFEAYAKEFVRVLKPGGVGAIHHGTSGGAKGGWRSNVTGKDVTEILTEAGLKVETQFTSWEDEDGTDHQAGLYEDAISVFSKAEGPA